MPPGTRQGRDTLDGLLFTKDKDEADPDKTVGLASNLQERAGENGTC